MGGVLVTKHTHSSSLTLFLRRFSPCFNNPGRSRIFCLIWTWSLAVLFHLQLDRSPSSAVQGMLSESSIILLLFLHLLFTHTDSWATYRRRSMDLQPPQWETRPAVHCCSTHPAITHSHTRTRAHTRTHKTHARAHTHTHTLTRARTYTHTCCFLWFTGTLHRRNGFYTVQAVCAIALHLPYT